METDTIISFDGKNYIVCHVYHRTIGSHDQRLTPYVTDRTEHRRTFGVVSRHDKLFWVKEYTQPDYGHSILYEFEETSKLHSTTEIGGNTIRTVDMISVQGNRLLMEYCDGYVKLGDANLDPDQKKTVTQLLSRWIDEHDVHDYDMCENNIMIKVETNLSLILIDFEYSIGVNEKRWLRFLKGWFNA